MVRTNLAGAGGLAAAAESPCHDRLRDSAALAVAALLVLSTAAAWDNLAQRAGTVVSTVMAPASAGGAPRSMAPQASPMAGMAMPATASAVAPAGGSGMTGNGRGTAMDAPAAPMGMVAETQMASSAHAGVAGLGLSGLGVFLAGWAVMMAAMMLPAIRSRLVRSAAGRGAGMAAAAVADSALLTVGYLLAWTIAGLPAYLAAQAIAMAMALRATLAELAPYGAALLPLAAGLYQFAPLLRQSLDHGRAPAGARVGRRRTGALGAPQAGVLEGAYSLGWCWVLFLAMAVMGAMSLAWVVAVALVVVAEKLLPRAGVVATAIGVLLLVLSAVVALQPGLLPVA